MNIVRRLSLVAVLIGALTAGCTRHAEMSTPIKTIADLKGRRCGTVAGWALQEKLEAMQEGISFSVFNDAPSMIEALRLGKIDAVPLDTVILRRWAAKCPGEFEVVARFADDPFGFIFQKGSPLCARVNDVLARMKAKGEIDRIVSKWCTAQDLNTVKTEPFPHKEGYSGKNGVLRFSTWAGVEPASFIRNEEVVGFDVDLAKWIACELDMGFSLLEVSGDAFVTAVQSGKADMGGNCITITDTRRQAVDFSECYLDDGISLLVKAAPRTGIRSAQDLKGKHVAHLSSDFHRKELHELQPDLVFDPYTEYAFAFESLNKKKIDAISLGKTYADIWMTKFPGQFNVAFDYANDMCAFLLPKNSPLKPKLDAELRRMNASGESQAIYRKWVDAVKTGQTPELPRQTAPADAPTVRVACANVSEPWCFLSRNEIVGIDLDILITVANRLGIRLKTKFFTFGGMVDCVNASRCEIACGGIYTNGNVFPTVDTSEKYADEHMCILVRNEDFVKKESGAFAFVQSLQKSFIRTFVSENRWKMLASGLGTTLLITLLASLFGTVLAFPVWLARTSRLKPIACCARVYIAVLQGTPVLVLLMILFYIVFGNLDIDGLWIAVIGFGLNLSAYAGEMLRSGVNSVPRGQTEAALALGYTPVQAFVHFVLPQAVRTVLPVYRGELIGLLKMTSIVGYIAIADLTKASDLIRSRTYESFFPIVTTAFIYFVVSWFLAFTLDRLGRRFTPVSTRAQKKGGAQ